MGRPALDLTGQKFGHWTVFARAEVEARHSFWHVVCDCGTAKIVRGNKLTTGESTRCVDCQRIAHRLEKVTYEGAHGRLRRWRGAAAAHPCIECGGQAAHWAYQGPNHNSGALAYSGDVEDYAPMCVPCHKNFDLEAVS